jgi:hypothetical protein
VTLVQRETSKVTDSDEVAFICKDVSGNPEVMLTPPDAGTDRQLTKNKGANLNLNSGDFEDYLIKAGFYNSGSIDGDDIAALGVKTANLDDLAITAAKIATNNVGPSQLDTGAVGADQIADNGVTPAKLGGFEVAGDNAYYSTGDFGGDDKTTQALSWTQVAKIRFMAPGTFRFYWRYLQDYDNQVGYWRVLKNGELIISVSDQGTAGSDPWHYRTDDLALVPGDVITFQAYVGHPSATAETNIWLKGENLTGIFDVH